MVGWMVVYTYVVWLAALHAMGCGPDGDEMHGLLLGLAPFAVVSALLMRATRPFPEIQRMLSWLGIPLVLLLPFVLRNIWTVFERANLNGLATCTNASAENFHRIWAPVQLTAVCVLVVVVVRLWRNARIEKP